MSSSKPPRYTIYCHTHVDSGRRYIGLTKKTMLQRWNQHVNKSKKMGDRRSHFWAAIRLYGKDAFSHEVLEVCHDLELANAAEIKWIEHFGTRDPQLGFNLANGGCHTPHPIKNPWNRPEYRAKSQAASQAKWQDPAFRQKVTDGVALAWQDPEHRARMSEVSKEINARPEVAARIRQSLQDRECSPETRDKISANARRNNADPDTKAAQSAAAKRRWDDPEYRRRQSESHAGKKTSEETRAKLSASSRSSDPAVAARIAASVREYHARRRATSP